MKTEIKKMFRWLLPSIDACDKSIVESIIGSKANNGLTQDIVVMNLYNDLKKEATLNREQKKQQNWFMAIITSVRIKRIERVMKVIETNYFDPIKGLVGFCFTYIKNQKNKKGRRNLI